MTWARLDDRFWCNEKVVSCPDFALGLHVRAITYCASLETDGIITPTALRTLRATAGAVRQLVLHGLWEPTGESFAIHDYLKYNPKKADLDSDRHSKSIAGAMGAAKRWGMARANAPVPTRPDPSRPDPSPPYSPPSDEGGRSPAPRRRRRAKETVTSPIILRRIEALRREQEDA